MIVEELGGDPRAGGLSRAALPIVLACVMVVLAMPADSNAFQPLDRLADSYPVRRLGLPADVSGVRMTVMPERLLNDTQPPALDWWPVSVRGTSGIASHDNGVIAIMWAERGTVYWLTSTSHEAGWLVGVAERMEPRSFLVYDRDGRLMAELR